MGRRPEIERFVEKIEVHPDTGCWLWTASLIGRGYGQFTAATGQMVYAHRWAYEHFVGPIPESTEVDHTCHNADQRCPGGGGCWHRRCVNPDHLEPVAHQENAARGQCGAHNARKTHCDNGHPLFGENLKIEASGSRRCRTCAREAKRRYEDRQKALA